MLALVLGACSSLPSGRPIAEIASEINATRTDSPFYLAPGDELAVRFIQFVEWDHETVVLPDGRAPFLSLDDVQVGGMTVDGLTEQLTHAYERILARPELAVLVTRVAPRNFYVMGEVGSPGTFELRAGRTSLVEALAMAQGPSRENAYLDRLLLVRWLPAENRVVTWSIDARPRYWNSPHSILLQPHDVLCVPAKPIIHVGDWINSYIRRLIPFPYLISPTG